MRLSTPALIAIAALTVILAACGQKELVVETSGAVSNSEKEMPVAVTPETLAEEPVASKPPANSDDGWITDLDQARSLARSQNKMLLIDFTATWCPPCQMYVDDIFPTNEFKRAAAEYILAKIDTDDQPSVARRHGVKGIPDIRLESPDGTELKKLVGYHGEKLIEEMAAAKSSAGL